MVPMGVALAMEAGSAVLLVHHPAATSCLWVFPGGYPPMLSELWFDVTKA